MVEITSIFGLLRSYNQNQRHQTVRDGEVLIDGYSGSKMCSESQKRFYKCMLLYKSLIRPKATEWSKANSTGKKKKEREKTSVAFSFLKHFY